MVFVYGGRCRGGAGARPRDVARGGARYSRARWARGSRRERPTGVAGAANRAAIRAWQTARGRCRRGPCPCVDGRARRGLGVARDRRWSCSGRRLGGYLRLGGGAARRRRCFGSRSNRVGRWRSMRCICRGIRTGCLRRWCVLSRRRCARTRRGVAFATVRVRDGCAAVDATSGDRFRDCAECPDVSRGSGELHDGFAIVGGPV